MSYITCFGVSRFRKLCTKSILYNFDWNLIFAEFSELSVSDILIAGVFMGKRFAKIS